MLEIHGNPQITAISFLSGKSSLYPQMFLWEIVYNQSINRWNAGLAEENGAGVYWKYWNNLRRIQRADRLKIGNVDRFGHDWLFEL